MIFYFFNDDGETIDAEYFINNESARLDGVVIFPERIYRFPANGERLKNTYRVVPLAQFHHINYKAVFAVDII